MQALSRPHSWCTCGQQTLQQAELLKTMLAGAFFSIWSVEGGCTSDNPLSSGVHLYYFPEYLSVVTMGHESVALDSS